MLLYFLIPLYLVLFSLLLAYTALTLLFSPSKPRRFLGIKIHGLIPSLVPDMVNQLTASAKDFLPDFEVLAKKFSGPERFEKITPLIESHVDEFLRNKLSTAMPMISMFIGDRTINQLKELFMRELRDIFPASINAYLSAGAQQVNLHTYIQNADTTRLEQTLIAELKNRLSEKKSVIYITMAVVGLLAGIILCLLLALAN